MSQVATVPPELLEIILIRTFAAFYAINITRLLPRADVTSLVAVSSVCYEWYATITGRRYNRQRLQRVSRTMVIL